MWSRRLSVARPVRIEAISCCRSETAFSILVLRFASTSFTEVNAGPLVAAGCSVFIAKSLRALVQLVNHGADGLTHRHTHYIAYRVQIENDNRELVIPAHGDGSGIHNAQSPGKHFQITDLRKFHRVGIFERILVV